MSGTLLIVEDDASMRELLESSLRRAGYEVTASPTAQHALEHLGSHDVDVVVSDLQLGGMDGLALCREAVAAQPGLPVIVMTAFGSLDTAIEAIRAGAYDFITKPFDTDVLQLAVARAIERRRLTDEVRRLREAVQPADAFGDLVGSSHAMRSVFALLERVADSDVTVLVTGESGTGKELVARALHDRGRRRDGPFVAINCAAVPETLLESELFGHVRGAFTDARTAREGLFVRATGGTLFLDEVGEMPSGMQAKLLRALQERTVRPVGAEKEVPFDARIVAATTRDLEALVEQGTFRQDLYFRLAVVEVPLPPLRARGDDVLMLAQHLLSRVASATGRRVEGFDPEAARRLLAYDWPGNVRELANCVERAVALARHDRVTADDLPDRVRRPPAEASAADVVQDADLVPLDEIERRYVTRVLAEVGGKRKVAARILGVDRKTLYRKLERWGMGGGD